jgi:hypothetical protein
MSQTIQVSDEGAALLKRQAIAHGVSVDAWVEALAREKENVEEWPLNRDHATAAAARILRIQSRVKPDPEGWTTRDYVQHGRR